MTTQTQNTPKRGLLTKRPFYRISPECGDRYAKPLSDIGEKSITRGKVFYEEVTQADFMRELDPNAHAINDPNVYKTFIQSAEDSLYYEQDFQRYAFAFQQEILDDRLVRLTGNDIQFDLSEKNEKDKTRQAYNLFKAAWTEKSMERAWYEMAKSTLATGDAAFVSYLVKGKFHWKVLSYLKGDTLYPHYDLRTGQLETFARTYTNFDSEGNIRNYIDVWDDNKYYRFIDEIPSGENKDGKTPTAVNGFDVSGYTLEYSEPHRFDGLPISYQRNDFGPCWSNSQECIEHFEAAFSRLAQNNMAFGLPILGLTQGDGKDIKAITTADLSYASKIFIIPNNGKAEFLNRQDASGAYKEELAELKKKIYEQSMVVKAPELKSGDTPAAAIKLLYSDAYNKAMNETMEFDACLDRIVEIFKWGAGVEKESRLAFRDLPTKHYIVPFLPVNESEICQNLALGVQNGFLSKETASERNPYAIPAEFNRIQKEKHDEQAQEILLQEQKTEIQTEAVIEQTEAKADIEVQQQNALNESESQTTATPVKAKKRGVSTGRGRKSTSGKTWDSNGNEIDPLTGKAKSKWDNWNNTH